MCFYRECEHTVTRVIFVHAKQRLPDYSDNLDSEAFHPRAPVIKVKSKISVVQIIA